ncbi:MAG: hypothetical protein JW830_00690 [Bacteroidales bacterium]|nr:hypothetical protein [Bacteroidales bacterium]
MGFADNYLRKQNGFSPYFTDLPSDKLRFAVVIPAYCEPGATDSLQALWNCTRPVGHVEVIVVVNSSEDVPRSVLDANLQTWLDVASWIKEHQDPAMRFLPIDSMKMPVRDAGVGLARKTGMDEALSRFNQIGNPGGFILSFDADSRCDDNYFTAIEDTLEENKTVTGFDVYFEHPITGKEFPEKIYRGIVDYELHMRCVNQFLRYTGFPYAHHTVGSCFGVRADAYAAQGGMNKRKAGEDFYFLHKIIPLGQFMDITGTRVIPSPRASNRAPFGTGAAISKYLALEKEDFLTYSPECFTALRLLFGQIAEFHKKHRDNIVTRINTLPEPLKSYLHDLHAPEAIDEINANSGSVSAFIKRFYRWFDAFRIVKYLNYASQHYYHQVPVREAAIAFLEITGIKGISEKISALELLEILRGIERNLNRPR